MKKRFRFTLLAVIWAVVMISFSLQSSYSQSCMPCEPNIVEHKQFTNFVLPQFPNCSLTVSYWLKKCPNSDEVFISDLSIFPDGSDCQAYIQYFIKTNPDGSRYFDGFAYNQIRNWVFDAISLELFSHLNPLDYECPDSYFTVKYVNSYCSAFRIIIYLNWVTGGFPNIGFRCMEQKNCAIGGCCIQKNKICYNALEDRNEITYDDSYTGTCPPQPKPVFLCTPVPGDIVLESECMAWCQPR